VCAPTPPTRAALGLIFCVLLLDVVGIVILWPIAAYLVRRYSDDALMLTLLNAIYAAAQFIAAPLLGKLGDRHGRRPVLLASLFGSAIGYVLFGLGGALWVLFLSRLVGGITAGNQSVAAAYIADVSTPETRAKNFTLIGMAWGLGLVLGPALGAALGQLDLAAPAYAAAALALVSALLGLVALPESLPRERRVTTALRLADLNPVVSIGEIARKPELGRLLLALCLFNLAFTGINSTETLYLIETFAAQPRHIGALLVLAGVTVALVQPVVRPLVRLCGEQRLAAAAVLGQALGAMATAGTPVLWPIYPLTVLRTVASGLTFPALGALMAGRVAPGEQGALMGVNAALGSAMGALGPVWAGVSYERVMPGAPYWIGAGAFALAAATLTDAPNRLARRRSA
jgi:DHA1 family tetracycline resistance protein-like MFS transporter